MQKQKCRLQHSFLYPLGNSWLPSPFSCCKQNAGWKFWSWFMDRGKNTPTACNDTSMSSGLFSLDKLCIYSKYTFSKEASLHSTFNGRLKVNLLFCVPFLSHHQSLKYVKKHARSPVYHTAQLTWQPADHRLDALCHCVHLPFPVFVHINK